MKKRYELIFQDDHFLVANKPPGLLTIPDRYNPRLPSLVRQLRSRFGEVLTVHRIDRDTSGLVVFARSKAVHKKMSMLFQERKVSKEYLAICDGIPDPNKGTVDLMLKDHPVIAGKMIVAKTGKKSISHYSLEKDFKEFSLLKVLIETGRQHQIRVQLSHLGHPLLVDKMYGKRPAFYLSEIKRKYKKVGKEAEKPLMARNSLHAHSLSFQHPISQESLSFIAPMPKDFRAVLNQFEKCLNPN